MSRQLSDPRDLARRVRSLRQLNRHTDPERFAVTVEDLAEQIEALDPPPAAPRYWRAAK